MAGRSGSAYFSGDIVLGDTTLTGAGGQDIALFSVSPAGAVRWATSHGGPGRDRAIGIAIGPDGSRGRRSRAVGDQTDSEC